MNTTKPQYLLLCDGSISNPELDGSQAQLGHWKFSLEGLDSGEVMEASDSESQVNSDRIALMAVVRGLEAIPEASSVALVTSSRYVWRGLQYGLAEWRETDFEWEHFGARQSIRNADLWRRVDRVSRFHILRSRLVESATTVSQAEQFPTSQFDESVLQTTVSGSETVSRDEVAGYKLRVESTDIPKRRFSNRLARSLRNRFATGWGRNPLSLILQTLVGTITLAGAGVFQISKNFVAAFALLIGSTVGIQPNSRSTAW